MMRGARPLLCLGILSVVACSKAEERTPAADSAATSAPPTPATATKPAEWRVTELGFGPLHAGMTIAQAAAVVPGTFASPSGDAASECEYASWSDAPPGVHVMLVSGAVARVDVDSQAVQTAAGATVGSSEARIDSLYQGRVRRMPHKYTPAPRTSWSSLPPTR